MIYVYSTNLIHVITYKDIYIVDKLHCIKNTIYSSIKLNNNVYLNTRVSINENTQGNKYLKGRIVHMLSLIL